MFSDHTLEEETCYNCIKTCLNNLLLSILCSSVTTNVWDTLEIKKNPVIPFSQGRGPHPMYVV